MLIINLLAKNLQLPENVCIAHPPSIFIYTSFHDFSIVFLKRCVVVTYILVWTTEVGLC